MSGRRRQRAAEAGGPSFGGGRAPGGVAPNGIDFAAAIDDAVANCGSRMKIAVA